MNSVEQKTRMQARNARDSTIIVNKVEVVMEPVDVIHAVLSVTQQLEHIVYEVSEFTLQSEHP